jgi:hypothetical protein
VNTNTLVVGQEVWMRSGPYTQKGKVVAAVSSSPGTVENGGEISVPKWYVEVEFLPHFNGGTAGKWDAGHFFIRFDANGKTGTGWDGLGFFEPHFGGTLQVDPRTPGTMCGPWELVTEPLAIAT